MPKPPGRVVISDGRLRSLARRPEFGALGATLVVYVFFVVVTYGHGFVTMHGTAGWLDSAADIGVVAVPTGLLLTCGEFDLSIGSMYAAASLTVAMGSGYYSLPVWVSIGLALGLALVVGAVNGILVTRTQLPSFIVTLAMNLGLAGTTFAVVYQLTGTSEVALQSSGATHALFAGRAAQFNVGILWWLALALIAYYVLNHSVFGNWLLATGGDQAAAREAGIPTTRVKIALFLATSLGAAIAGVIATFEFNGGTVGSGQTYVFDTIITAVIGGVLVGGGYGSSVGLILGAATYGIIEIGIYYTGWSTDWAQVILGGLLLGAVLANNAFRRLATSSR